MDFYAFYRGQEFEAYDYLGAHMIRADGGGSAESCAETDCGTCAYPGTHGGGTGAGPGVSGSCKDIDTDFACTTIFRTFAPSASKVSVIGEWNGWEEVPMYKVYDGNFWECRIEGTRPFQMYKYRIYDRNGHPMDHCDPYAFMAELRPGSASRLYLPGSYEFHDEAYLRQRLHRGPSHHNGSARLSTLSHGSSICHGHSICTGGSPDPAESLGPGTGLKPGNAKYPGSTPQSSGPARDGSSQTQGSGSHPDALCRSDRTSPAAKVPGLPGSTRLPALSPDHSPINIYELHAGAWRVPNPSEPWNHYTYRELADLLVPYLRERQYNYLELMPLTEYPCDESWGYQTTGFFAPTSRYGTPDDLKYLIDLCHANGIGVILDFVAVHFSANDYALRMYDGTPLYEYPDGDMSWSEWGTCNFMHSRGEVGSFLKSSIHYWLREFHIDGIRVDAVRNLIYWQGNETRGENRSGIEFLRSLNAGIREHFPDVLLIAEDSSAYPGVTRPISEGGLGFDYKWDLGWMNDTLQFLKTRPGDRKYQYHKLTFSIFYYYNEKYLLPLSHDEVVHGKATIVQKMHGDNLDDKFAQARALYAYMYAHPGKKLNFMGNELGGLWEWSEKKEIDWWLLKDHPRHRAFNDFLMDLVNIYMAYPSLWSQDYERDGFEWTDCGNEGKYAVYSFMRRDRKTNSGTSACLRNHSAKLRNEYLKGSSANRCGSTDRTSNPCSNEGIIRNGSPCTIGEIPGLGSGSDSDSIQRTGSTQSVGCTNCGSLNTCGGCTPSILAVFNFDCIDVRGYEVVLPERDIIAGSSDAGGHGTGTGTISRIRKILDSDLSRYGGRTLEPASERPKADGMKAEDQKSDGQETDTQNTDETKAEGPETGTCGISQHGTADMPVDCDPGIPAPFMPDAPYEAEIKENPGTRLTPTAKGSVSIRLDGRHVTLDLPRFSAQFYAIYAL